jgi:tripeptidyl-peptidase I
MLGIAMKVIVLFYVYVWAALPFVYASESIEQNEQRVYLEPEGGTISFSKHWERGSRCTPKEEITIHTKLTLSPEVSMKLEKRLLTVSDPTSEDYGKYFSREELTKFLAVSDEQVKTVRRFLGVRDSKLTVSPHKDAIEATMSCAQAEAIFRVELFSYTHIHTNTTTVRASQRYSVPSTVAPYLSIVSGLSSVPIRRFRLKLSGSSQSVNSGFQGSPWKSCSANCDGQIVPSVLQSQYRIPTSTIPATAIASGMAVAEFASNWDQEGLNAFANACALPVNLTVDRMVGTNGAGICQSRHGGPTCAEAMLDITYIKALAGNIKLTDVFQSNEFSIQKWALEVAQMSDREIPLVQSVSFGEDEHELPSVPYMNECNVEFQKLGLRGVTILFASGDGGVWGRGGTTGGVFHPDFPASSPYVTAVGGTVLSTAGTIGNETAWSNSGGGFSNVFPQPSYQKGAVSDYIKRASNSLPQQKYWNSTGRAYPDVSALAGGQNAYCVSVDGKSFNAFTGTSASTPVWAAIIARLNTIRVAKGGKPLGFLNPLIYKNPQAFFDVTSGINSAGTGEGFAATTGWDPATGMGTPNFNALAKL